MDYGASGKDTSKKRERETKAVMYIGMIPPVLEFKFSVTNICRYLLL